MGNSSIFDRIEEWEKKGMDDADLAAFQAGASKPSEELRSVGALRRTIVLGLAEMDNRLRELEAKR